MQISLEKFWKFAKGYIYTSADEDEEWFNLYSNNNGKEIMLSRRYTPMVDIKEIDYDESTNIFTLTTIHNELVDIRVYDLVIKTIQCKVLKTYRDI